MRIANADQGIYWLLVQILFQTKHRIQPIAERHGLTLMQANTLALLDPSEPLTMHTLALYLACDASNVTGIADRLEDRGLIQRQDHPKDRRVKMIVLTSKGIHLQKQVITETLAVESDRLDPLFTAAERESLKAMLCRVLESQLSEHSIERK